ncbi:hypothetical protein VTJ04DRAFT_2160 [Mycothermus thermophilus]|uniref:uncharacterized protein n=1 Tax=Humicola insolens TaxID=85995 RepID=UPI00374427F5
MYCGVVRSGRLVTPVLCAQLPCLLPLLFVSAVSLFHLRLPTRKLNSASGFPFSVPACIRQKGWSVCLTAAAASVLLLLPLLSFTSCPLSADSQSPSAGLPVSLNVSSVSESTPFSHHTVRFIERYSATDPSP